YSPRLRRLLIITSDHQANALQRMPWGFENLDASPAEGQLEAILNGDVRKCDPGLRPEINPGSSARGEFLVPGDKIGMQVGLKNVADDKPVFFGGLEIKIHVALRINHDRFTLRPEHVRSVGQATQIKLFEIHAFMITPIRPAGMRRP